ncbi:DUF1292 domain-containing protein [bacterium]|jgi:uncharacterized protein YrzB (UPF0473 family)|nr:DUF1292 domain-containing protein [bacterium]
MTEEKENIIETVDEDGNVIQFNLFDVIEYEGKEYALLLPVDEDEEDDDAEMILMRLVSDGDEYSFETIDDEAEFEAVSEYLESFEDEE